MFTQSRKIVALMVVGCLFFAGCNTGTRVDPNAAKNGTAAGSTAGTGTGGSTNTGTGTGADLSITAFTSKAAAKVGEWVDYTVSVENTGTKEVTTPSMLGLLSSTDNNIDPQADYLYDYAILGPIPVGGKVTEADLQQSGEFMFRATTPVLQAGSSTLGAFADAAASVAEADETNNGMANGQATAFAAATGVDLTPTSPLQLSAAAVPATAPFDITFSVANVGPTDATAFEIIVAAQDAQQQTALIAQQALQGIQAGQNGQLTITAAIPGQANLAKGQTVIIVLIDYDLQGGNPAGAVAESDENNNVQVEFIELQ